MILTMTCQIVEAVNKSGWVTCLERMRGRVMGKEHELRSRRLLSRGFCVDPVLWRDALEIDYSSQGEETEEKSREGEGVRC